MIELTDRQRARFLSKIKPGATPDECWTWTGSFFDEGYGQYTVRTTDGRKNLYVHRIAYEMLVGLIPDGLTLDHLCRNRACCNPQHLEPVTTAENIGRGAQCKLSAMDVLDIRAHCRRWGDQRRYAEKYGVNPNSISNILHGRTHRHLLSQETHA